MREIVNSVFRKIRGVETVSAQEGNVVPRDSLVNAKWDSPSNKQCELNMNVASLKLIPGQLSLAQLRLIYQQPVKLSLDESAITQIEASVACVDRILNENRTVYGINTGFGLFASTRIASEDLESLQRSLVLSHAAGIGEPISNALVRLIMVLKVNSLSRGFSGIRLQVIEALIKLINAEVYPLIPLKGSVGASGDIFIQLIFFYPS